MIDLQAVTALADNYIWIAPAPGNHRVLIVDPGDAEPARAWLREHGAQPAAILLTHHHGDHVGGAAELARAYGAPVYGPATERIGAVDHPVGGGARLEIDGFGTIEVLDVPGHTAGHIAYHGDGALFCGDALFAGGCGRVFEGTAEQMHASLQRLAGLPGETRVCCGHEYTVKNLEFAARVEPGNERLARRLEHARALRQQGRPTVPSTLEEERATNPFLRTDSAEVQAAAERRAGQPLADAAAVFATLRRWKDQGG
ncbi:hydroxyacylglutathione hydrolase [Halorhodospira neutriphila]|uniref:Hydroxyacylglutathione hydrolase n=1 Tax=Halorhodospira neutriphila TaxID=168379 RepID=A0ABS1E611_9GAMM|nr:hydroxyacylglutathione hydrolase [Halorhodospira neutriphila]MBK1727173.1 hydroxyacylglutathione hydrolase [Halorhodospira neutriphila]